MNLATTMVFLQKLSRQAWLRLLIMILLLVWLAQVVVRTLWIAVAGPQDVVLLPASLVVIQAGSTAGENTPSPTEIEKWSLFGEAEAVATPGAAEGQGAPETNLRLTLLGVFAHGDDAMAGAIIASNPQDGKLYHPGDALPGGATLLSVLPDRVLIRRSGRTESLSFEKPVLGGSIAPSKSGAVAAASQGGIPQQRNMVIKQLALEAVSRGAAQGYKVTDSISQEAQSSSGLKPGDTILSVNGRPLGTEEADQAAIQSFYDDGKAEVEVQRGAGRITLTYPP